MSLEQALNDNTAAVKELIAALKAGGGAGAASTAAADKPVKGKAAAADKAEGTKAEKAKGYEPKYTKAQAQAAANQVKEDKGVAAAKALIKDLGYEKLAEIEKPEDIDKLYEAAKKALGEDEGGDDDNI